MASRPCYRSGPNLHQRDDHGNDGPPLPPRRPSPAAKKAAKTPYKGSISAIDASSVTVASTEKTLTLAITPSTKFGIKGKTKDYTAATAG